MLPVAIPPAGTPPRCGDRPTPGAHWTFSPASLRLPRVHYASASIVAALVALAPSLAAGATDAMRDGRGRFGLVLEDGWDEAPADRPLAVSVHGLHSGPFALHYLLRMAEADGVPCARFRYPADQAIAASARLLARELKALAGKHPRREVALVTHSMGGLVAREAVENRELDPGNVRRLIMFCPPNHGSVLAQFAFGLGLSGRVGGGEDRRGAGLFLRVIEDGLSEAYADLKPDSRFLRRLNARRRNPEIRYSIFLGDGGLVDEKSVVDLRRRLESPTTRWGRLFGAKLRPLLEDLDEVIAGRGDGVVAVKRGRLEGVEDVIVMHFNHVTIVRGNSQEVQKARRMALARLKGEEP